MTKRLGFEYLQGKISDVGMISGLYYEDYNGQIPMYIQNLVMRLQETLYRVIETHDMHRFRKGECDSFFRKTQSRGAKTRIPSHFVVGRPGP